MVSPVNPPRGMRDFLPAEKARREAALAVIRDVYTQHGFEEIETPALEDAARLHSGLGGDNEKLAYNVLKRALSAEELTAAAAHGDGSALADLGLRFDLTVPLARFYASHRAELPTVFRALQFGSVWRAERPQKGRYRQFVQCDIDIVGESGLLAEGELIAATSEALTALGIGPITVRINDRRLLSRLLTEWRVPAGHTERALISIDKLDKIGVRGVVAELADLGIASPDVGDALNRLSGLDWDLAAAQMPDWLDPAVFAGLQQIRSALPNVSLRFDPTLVRGMGYYTGTIFEVAHPDSGSSLAGGGRYDGMIGRFLGSEVPAVGFSIGFERILELVPEFTLDTGNSVVLVHEHDADAAQLMALKSSLLAAGRRVRLERRPRNLKPLLAMLGAAGYSEFALIDSESTAQTLELRPLS